jgi:hypothetical protein
VIDTFAYDGTVPGPVLRLREGRQISIDIRNDTDVDDIIHWHVSHDRLPRSPLCNRVYQSTRRYSLRCARRCERHGARIFWVPVVERG